MKKKRKRLKKALSPLREARDEQHEKFCLEYIKDYNATRAAIAAGYSERTASEQGCRLLTKVKPRINQLLAKQQARVQMEGDEILLETKKLATSDIRRIFDEETGCLLPMKDWPDDIAGAVASVKVKELYNQDGKLIGYMKEVKFWDKPKGLELLGRNKGLFKDGDGNNVQVNVMNATDEQLDEAFKRSNEKFGK